MAMTEVFMGNSKQYTDEFRAEAVKQVIERGFTVVDVASRIGIPKHTLYGWVQAAKKTMPAAGATVAPSDSAEIRRLKAESDHDLTINGPTLAAQAIAAGLVDEYHLFITTSVVGGGKRFLPDGVRLDLDLVEHRAFESGLIYARYQTR